MTLLSLLKEKAYQNRKVTLASGKTSQFYIDVKRISLSAEGAVLLGRELYNLIQKLFPSAEGIGGLTLGADPLATAIAYTSQLDKHPLQSFIVRKEPKKHGLSKWIEGVDLLKPNAKVCILEDVVTTGGSSLKAVQKVKEFGWTVLGVVAVVDRQEGGKEALQKEGLSLYSLYTKSDFGILN